MKRILVMLSLPLVIKVANSEWVLGVHMQHFQNLYNAEIRNDMYCCCDISSYVLPCANDPTDLNVTACNAECEPYYEIRFEVCFADGMCSTMKNETAVIGNILSTCLSPLLIQLHAKDSMIDNTTMNDDIINITLYVTVWDSSLGEPGEDFIIDQFTITIPGTVSNCVDESNSLTVQGQHGVGNLTLAYYNLTTDPITSCSSADVPTFSTSSSIPTIGACECSSSPTSSPDESVSTTSPVWTPLAIIFLLVTIVLAVISGVLGFIVYRTRKDVSSWISSKLTSQREHRSTGLSTDGATDNQGIDECQHVYSTVHKKGKEVVDEPSYMNTDTMQPEPYFYDKTTQDY